MKHDVICAMRTRFGRRSSIPRLQDVLPTRKASYCFPFPAAIRLPPSTIRFPSIRNSPIRSRIACAVLHEECAGTLDSLDPLFFHTHAAAGFVHKQTDPFLVRRPRPLFRPLASWRLRCGAAGAVIVARPRVFRRFSRVFRRRPRVYADFPAAAAGTGRERCRQRGRSVISVVRRFRWKARWEGELWTGAGCWGFCCFPSVSPVYVLFNPVSVQLNTLANIQRSGKTFVRINSVT